MKMKMTAEDLIAKIIGGFYSNEKISTLSDSNEIRVFSKAQSFVKKRRLILFEGKN